MPFMSHAFLSVCHVIAGVQHHILSFSVAWDGNSVWDLPIDSMAQAPTIEQMQQLEKAKTAKVNCISAYLIGTITVT